MKHTCKKRRERVRSPGRKEKERRALKGLAAAGAIAGGTQAYAAPVRFDNAPPGDPAYFDWNETNGEISRFLDVTLDLEDQPSDTAAASPICFGQVRDVYAYYGLVQAKADPSKLQVGGYYNYVLVGVSSGELIPSGTAWLDFGYADWSGAETPEGIATYLGVKFDPGDGLHYGWIGVVRTGTRFEAFAWGYETEPGASIAAGAESAADIPTVSEWGLAVMSLALLAAGTWVVRKRIPQPKPPAAA